MSRPDPPKSTPRPGSAIRRVAVAFAGAGARADAEILAQRLGLPLAGKFNDPHPMHLTVIRPGGGDPAPGAEDAESGDPQTRLELRIVAADHPLAGGHGVWADLAKLDTTSGAGRSLKSPLFKAVGVKSGVARPRVLDATAGLGEDAWLLAAAGCEVVAVERQPIVHALLGDALRRARAAAPDVAARITLTPCRDAADVLAENSGGFDVVLIDPMFPGAQKRKTAERKPLRVLRWLAGEDPDADKLWPLALQTAKRRVVVKRPRRAPHLAGQTPVVSHAGRGFRFDVYPTSNKS